MATAIDSDAQIRESVIEEMEYDPVVTAHDIDVTVHDRTVTLTGVADAYGTRQAAEQAAWRVFGVRNVIDQVIVNPSMLGMPTDDEIARNLRGRLEKDVLVPQGRITADVQDGIVTLTGTVNWHLQRFAAEDEALKTVGVRKVVNQITIDRSHASPSEIEAAIRKALTRSAQVAARQIQVSVEGAHVTLTGTVRSFAERQAAEDAAWRAKGVTEVTDNLAIQPV
jgi:osmotically-inducible protein OsmY